ncbi:MAG: hypothetical protein ACK5V3_16085 [Bdellovibrionales bacterium]
MKNLMVLASLLISLQSLALTAPKIEEWSCEFKHPSMTSAIQGTFVQITTQIGKNQSEALVYPICPACRVQPRKFAVGANQVGKTLIFANVNELFSLNIRTEGVKANNEKSFAAATLGNRRGLCRLVLR